MKTISQARLKEILHYDPDTGIFVWLAQSATSIVVGDQAGYINTVTNQHMIGFGGKKYNASRLAYLYMTGEHPPRSVLHTNGIGYDNRWLNLKLSREKVIRTPRAPKAKTRRYRRSS